MRYIVWSVPAQGAAILRSFSTEIKRTTNPGAGRSDARAKENKSSTDVTSRTRFWFVENRKFKPFSSNNDRCSLADPKDAIHVDKEMARDVTDGYIQIVNAELFARASHLNIATQRFATFLGLKELPSKFKAVLSIAGTLLPMVAPELFMAKWLQQSEEEVKRALVVASALGNKGARAVNAINKGKEIVGKVVESSEKSTARAEALAKIQQDAGVADLKKMDAIEEVANKLIETSNRSYAIWRMTLSVLTLEYQNRLENSAHPSKESLEAMATRLLPLPDRLSKDELLEAETLYLYEIIARWASANVVITDDIEDWTSDGGDIVHNIHRRGLNDNQEETIMDLFGTSAPRGRIFQMPPVVNLTSQLQVWGVPQTSNTRVRHWTGHQF
jgi:hypothetical protein